MQTLIVFRLYEKIEPEKSSFKFAAKRVTITLKKWLETSWKELTRAAKKWSVSLVFINLLNIMVCERC